MSHAVMMNVIKRIGRKGRERESMYRRRML